MYVIRSYYALPDSASNSSCKNSGFSIAVMISPSTRCHSKSAHSISYTMSYTSVEARITSYNVCYTKLLRLGCSFVRLDNDTLGSSQLTRPVPNRLARTASLQPRAEWLLDTTMSEDDIWTGVHKHARRITSYNVCYTKLLRTRK